MQKVQIRTAPAKITGDYFAAGNRGIIYAPGFSEHRHSYRHYARAANQRGLAALTIDINGQGASTGRFALTDIATSINELAHHARDTYGWKAVGVQGNSIGGMAAAKAAADNAPIDALALTSTPDELTDDFPAWLRAALRRADTGITHQLYRAALETFDRAQTTFNKRYRQRTKRERIRDDHVHLQFGALRADVPSELVNAIEHAPRLADYAAGINVPVYAVFGKNDHFVAVKNDGLKNKIEHALRQIPDATWHVIPGADHSINRHTPMDANFNEDPRYAFVKDRLLHFFEKTLDARNQ